MAVITYSAYTLLCLADSLHNPSPLVYSTLYSTPFVSFSVLCPARSCCCTEASQPGMLYATLPVLRTVRSTRRLGCCAHCSPAASLYTFTLSLSVSMCTPYVLRCCPHSVRHTFATDRCTERTALFPRNRLHRTRHVSPFTAECAQRATPSFCPLVCSGVPVVIIAHNAMFVLRYTENCASDSAYTSVCVSDSPHDTLLARYATHCTQTRLHCTTRHRQKHIHPSCPTLHVIQPALDAARCRMRIVQCPLSRTHWAPDRNDVCAV